MPDWEYIWYNIKELWERLGVRKRINDNPKIVFRVTIASVLLFLLIMTALLIPHKSAIVPRTPKAWFYDLNTNKLFAADSDKIPPIDAPSGKGPDGQPAGVKAYVLSYFSDPNESERFIGYLEKFTPQGREIVYLLKESRDNATKEKILQLNQNRFIRRPDDKEWSSADSNEGRDILELGCRLNEKGQPPNYCSPK